MSDQGNNDQLTPAGQPNLDEIPVEELIRLTREFTRRITNQDRQRETRHLHESGHQRALQISAPVTLQQFFAGEIDLDSELSRRFQNAPLLSHVRFIPEPGTPLRRQATALLSSQDDSTTLSVDAHLNAEPHAALEFTFTLFSALALNFRLDALIESDRRRWLELMRRRNGIAFLWTRERWEQSYLIFVIREFFARVYAFSPYGFEAAVRLTPDMVEAVVEWLVGLWFPDEQIGDTAAAPPEWDQRPTLPQAPDRDRIARALAAQLPPDAPEEQWDDEPGETDDDGLAANDLEW